MHRKPRIRHSGQRWCCCSRYGSARSDHEHMLPVYLQQRLLMHTQRNQFVRMPRLFLLAVKPKRESDMQRDSSPWLACTLWLDAAAGLLHTIVVDAFFWLPSLSELVVTTRRIRGG
jgi:hypothetical protein